MASQVRTPSQEPCVLCGLLLNRVFLTRPDAELDADILSALTVPAEKTPPVSPPVSQRCPMEQFGKCSARQQAGVPHARLQRSLALASRHGIASMLKCACRCAPRCGAGVHAGASQASLSAFTCRRPAFVSHLLHGKLPDHRRFSDSVLEALVPRQGQSGVRSDLKAPDLGRESLSQTCGVCGCSADLSRNYAGACVAQWLPQV